MCVDILFILIGLWGSSFLVAIFSDNSPYNFASFMSGIIVSIIGVPFMSTGIYYLSEIK
jgi:hypothetical protein